MRTLMLERPRKAGWWITSALCIALAACGGGDDSPPSYAIGGTVTGLASGTTLSLQNNGGDSLAVTSAGPFDFLKKLQSGAAYSVSVQTQPAGQSCSVANGSGTVAAADVTSVAVSCVAAVSYSVGGTVSGLPAGASVGLLDNGGDALTVSASGAFTFATGLAPGATYAVTVGTQPAGANCTVSGGSGTVAAASIGNVAVTCTPTGVSSSTTSSTAFAVLATGNARIAFVAGTLGVLPVSIDGVALATPAGTRARPANVSAAAASVASPSVTLSFSPDSCTVDSSALIVSCISYNATKLAFLDVRTFANSLNPADITATEFDSGAPTSSTRFSGGSCQLCGIVALTGQQSIVVSAYDGYRVYAYPAAGATSPLTPVKSYAVAITENFAADPVRQWIAASEYYQSGGNRKLRLINMANDKIYVWTVNSDVCDANDLASACNDFRSEETDSETFDLATGMLVMQSESGNSQLMLDLGQATFDDTALTFTAPHQYADVTNSFRAEMSGALASPSGSWLFMVPEFSAGYAGVQALPTAAGTGGTFPTYAANPVFVDLNAVSSISPCANTLFAGHDPHSQGFTTSVAGVALGLFVTLDKSCIVKVDLSALYNAPRKTGQATLTDPTYDLVANHVLTYLKTN